jgi:tripartite-type tricarboxylate transporter receptor subunit TctC
MAKLHCGCIGTLLSVGALLTALTGGSAAMAAEAFPTRPVRVIVPFAAGGTFDLVARVVSQRLTETWGHQVVVDNRPGGATIIATSMTVKAAPDGHTIYLSPNALAANPSLYKDLPYDAMRDLAPVVLIAAQPMALGANPSFKARTVRELLDIAKAQPDSLSYGTAGIGSGGHLAGEIFKSMAGIEVRHISYKGGNIAMMDVVANNIPLVVTGLPNLLPLHRDGRIRILGITSRTRSSVDDQIPALGETVQGYEFKNWFGFVVPAKTPLVRIKKVNMDVNNILSTGGTREKLTSQGFDVLGGTPEEFAATIVSDTKAFSAVLAKTRATAR